MLIPDTRIKRARPWGRRVALASVPLVLLIPGGAVLQTVAASPASAAAPGDGTWTGTITWHETGGASISNPPINTLSQGYDTDWSVQVSGAGTLTGGALLDLTSITGDFGYSTSSDQSGCTSEANAAGSTPGDLKPGIADLAITQPAPVAGAQSGPGSAVRTTPWIGISGSETDTVGGTCTPFTQTVAASANTFWNDGVVIDPSFDVSTTDPTHLVGSVSDVHDSLPGATETVHASYTLSWDLSFDNLTPVYVAMGDSYASGEGLRPFGYGSAADGCDRSSQAFGPQEAKRLSGVQFLFTACSGATTNDILVKPKVNDPSSPDHLTQVQRLQKANDAPGQYVKYVSLSVGGDDAHFVDVMQTCGLDALLKYLPPPLSNAAAQRCNAYADKAMNIGQINSDVLATLEEIAFVAPKADIFVLDYPHLFNTTDGGVGACIIPGGSKQHIDDLTDQLDNAIASAALAAGHASTSWRCATRTGRSTISVARPASPDWTHQLPTGFIPSAWIPASGRPLRPTHSRSLSTQTWSRSIPPRRVSRSTSSSSTPRWLPTSACRPHSGSDDLLGVGGHRHAQLTSLNRLLLDGQAGGGHLDGLLSEGAGR